VPARWKTAAELPMNQDKGQPVVSNQDLNTRQKAYLRGLGQTLRPQLQVGHGGYGEGMLQALNDLFRKRELVKVRVLRTAEESPWELARQLAEASGAVLVGAVGRTALLYRPNPDLKERIELPR
jgi:RNA-binding protein